jgi:hypothetical protein
LMQRWAGGRYHKTNPCDLQGCANDKDCMGVTWVAGDDACYRVKKGNSASGKHDWHMCIKTDDKGSDYWFEGYSKWCASGCNPDKMRDSKHCTRSPCVGSGKECRCFTREAFAELYDKKNNKLATVKPCESGNFGRRLGDNRSEGRRLTNNPRNMNFWNTKHPGNAGHPDYCCTNGIKAYPCYNR